MLIKLFELLSSRQNSQMVFNQYLNENILNNLRLYLDFFLKLNNNILLIGEAPGYNGCRITGIPFTSGSIIKNSNHTIFSKIKDEIYLNKIVSEPTATITWELLNNSDMLPVFWNAFPFHPHKINNPESNRKPNKDELNEGISYLNLIIEIIKPKRIYAVGRVSEKLLRQNRYKNIRYIRHPSYGGKKEFSKGISEIKNCHFT